MLRGAFVENATQLEYVGRQAAKEVQQYSDVVTDLTSEKALLLVNRRLAKAEEHTRQLLAQLKAKNEQVDDLTQLNNQLQHLLQIKDERLDGALSTQKSLEEAAAIARQQRDEALLEVKKCQSHTASVPDIMGQNLQLQDQVKESAEQVEGLRLELLEATSSSEKMQEQAKSLRESNAELQKQSDLAHQTLQHEKSLNAKLTEHNKELLREYRELELSRDRVVEVVRMYKGKVGNLSEQVEDLQIDSVSKSVYMARNQARIEQLSSVVATTQHHLRRGTSMAPSMVGPSPSASAYGASLLPTPHSRHGRSRHGQPNEERRLSAEEGMTSRSHSRPAPLPSANLSASPSAGAPLQPARSASILGQQPSVGSRYPPHGSAPSPFQQVQPPMVPHPAAPLINPPHGDQTPGRGYSQAYAASRNSGVTFRAPGMPEHVGPVRPGPPGQQQQLRMPAGHTEWEQALQAAANEHAVHLATQQQAQWMAQGKGRNPDAAHLGAVPSHGASTSRARSKDADGAKRRAPPGPLPSQADNRRAHKSVRPHHPSQEYMEYSQETGRKHLVQTQTVK